MATLHDIESIIEQNPEICDVGRSASPALIAKAEDYLRLRFPADYRRFLERWGTLAIGPLEFYGITGGDFESSSVPNAIWMTKAKRQQVGLPDELVILFDNNGAEYYCLDTSEPETSRIVIWDTHSRKVQAVKAESLFEFVVNEVAEVI